MPALDTSLADSLCPRLYYAGLSGQAHLNFGGSRVRSPHQKWVFEYSPAVSGVTALPSQPHGYGLRRVITLAPPVSLYFAKVRILTGESKGFESLSPMLAGMRLRRVTGPPRRLR